MTQAFKADSVEIGDLLNGDAGKPRLVIPRFQREYSWGERQITAFWKDLIRFNQEKAANSASKYFFGPIVISVTQADKIIAVLDGQQRVATTTIFFAALRNVAAKRGTTLMVKLANSIQNRFIEKNDAGDHLGWCVELGELDCPYFRDSIQRDSPAQPPILPTLKSHYAIRKAKEQFEEHITGQISELDDASAEVRIKQLRDAVRSDFVVTCIEVENERDAFQVFETLNDRGIKLSPSDLLLNLLMKNASDSDRPTIRTQWNQMIVRMGKKYSLSDFLRDFWISRFGDLKNVDLYSKLRDHISDKHLESLNFVNKASDECEQWCTLQDPSAKSVPVAFKQVAALLSRLGTDMAMPLLLSAFGRMSDNNFDQLVRLLLVFIVRHDVVANMSTTSTESLFFSLAMEVRNSLTDEKKKKTDDEVIASVKEQLIKASPSKEKLEASIPSLNLSQGEAVYIIDRIASYLQAPSQELMPQKANIEHIFPKKPKVGEWTVTEELQEHLWHIGNMTMLGVKLNQEAANRGFAYKKSEVYAKSELEMAKALLSYSDWDVASIKSRGKELGKKLIEIWDFNNTSRV